MILWKIFYKSNNLMHVLVPITIQLYIYLKYNLEYAHCIFMSWCVIPVLYRYTSIHKLISVLQKWQYWKNRAPCPYINLLNLVLVFLISHHCYHCAFFVIILQVSHTVNELFYLNPVVICFSNVIHIHPFQLSLYLWSAVQK